MKEKQLALCNIEIRSETQQRTRISNEVIKEYEESLSNGAVFPPIDVFFDGASYILGNGRHRIEAFKRLGRENINAIVRNGTLRDAILFSCQANTDHGLRRTSEDKRRAVMTLLTDSEWSRWSAREIAKKCFVSHAFVNSVKNELSGNGVLMPPEVKFSRNGKTHSQASRKRSKYAQNKKVSDYWSNVISAAFTLQNSLEDPLATAVRPTWPWYADLQSSLDSLHRAAGLLKAEAQSAEIKAKATIGVNP